MLGMKIYTLENDRETLLLIVTLRCVRRVRGVAVLNLYVLVHYEDAPNHASTFELLRHLLRVSMYLAL